MVNAVCFIVFLLIVYGMPHLDEWGVSHNTTPDGYHTDWGEFSKDITLHGKSYAMKQYNRGKYTVKDE